MKTFQGQKAVVSGATRGIGRAIALAFLQKGATVIGTYGSDEKAAAELRREAADLDAGPEATLHLHQCDVADHAEVTALFAQLEERFDSIDILVNNAGIRMDAVVAMMKPASWQRVLDVNLTGTFNMSRQAVLLMLKRKYGRIVNIVSPMAHLGFEGQANYAASKAGQIGFTRSLSKEIAKRHITVNCVSPGFIDTGLLDDLGPEKLAAYRKMVPMHRFGTPEEVAASVLFLAGPEAAYITGAVLDINGGL